MKVILVICLIIGTAFYIDPSSLKPWVSVVSNVAKMATQSIKDIGLSAEDFTS
jgi:hypothetical protein